MIGGRDQQQNELVVKKYLNDGMHFMYQISMLVTNYLSMSQTLKYIERGLLEFDVSHCMSNKADNIMVYTVQVTCMFMLTFMVQQVW